ncbi:MAG: MurR/RpiR family transcriptional regulator [Rhizobium sp.]|uniref:MurR/RpiR family transcriptional regulator n=1 Tax=Rhizobium sp. SYY.PMSO TaxID=3382192 RepID=UPI000DD581AE
MAKPRNGEKKKRAIENGKKVDIEALLRAHIATATPSEQSVAAFMLENLQMLSFETGGSIAKAVGVSEMTVLRVARGLGFQGFRDLKSKLRSAVEKEGDLDDYTSRFKVRDKRHEVLQESLRLELDAIVKAYALATTELWDDATSALARTRTIYVVGFQAIKGLAMDFASRLLWTRPNVIFVDSASGTYGEIIAADPAHSLVVLIDAANYATRSIKLAQRLKDIGMPLIIVTDMFSHWGFAYTEFVFEAHAHVQTYWDSSASINVVLNLLINTVAMKLGSKATKHCEVLTKLMADFDEFVSVPTLNHKQET